MKQNQKGTCDIILNGVQVSFFYYPNKIVKDFIITEEIPKLKMASILDIAIMKVVAIGGRGSKKNFFVKIQPQFQEIIENLILK